MSTTTTAHDLRAALKRIHPGDEYVTLFEVPARTGRAPEARADALVMSLWPSRGIELCGFEFKVDRGDWLAELKAPAKADIIGRHCDRWCVFASAGVVKAGEVPIGWGLWELQADGAVRRTVQAPAREAEPLPREMLAALLRARAKLDGDDLCALEAQFRREWERRAAARAPTMTGSDVDTLHDQADVQRAMRKLDEIRAATGIDLRHHLPARAWIERMRLADSPQLLHKLRLLRDLMGDPALRARIDTALADTRQPDAALAPPDPARG